MSLVVGPDAPAVLGDAGAEADDGAEAGDEAEAEADGMAADADGEADGEPEPQAATTMASAAIEAARRRELACTVLRTSKVSGMVLIARQPVGAR